ncbi:methyltransferase [Nocardioides lijunqiniae]|uniref:methyltransferase n=1 Tax=Nocardioides lijunqiniae TaxID=2760832 RepID=UPI001D0BF97C|nr:methyltransferase [Nocardioides lijunqiniae]
MSTPPAPEPDTKDWTWVLMRPCTDCGFVAADVDRAALGAAVRANAEAFALALRAPGATRRPDAGTWSVAEYSCHVRDVHRVFEGRVRSMLEADAPVFPNWDQDETALAERYDLQEPAVVGPELVAAAEGIAAAYDAVPDDAWERRGLRSNGSAFTVDTLARYHLHDVVHHLWDVRDAVTVGAYDAAALDYRDATQVMPDSGRRVIRAFADSLRAGARVLEIGSGGGRDARALEDVGLSVRRTDVTPSFVSLLRDTGVDADVLDPLTDDLDDPARPGQPYDGVWAGASLLHVARADLPVVLTRLAAATRPGGALRMSVKEGDGEGWSTHGVVRAPRMFVYWREQPLRSVLDAAGWLVEDVHRAVSDSGEHWLGATARRR